MKRICMSTKYKFKPKFNLKGLFSKKVLTLISLFFMATIVFSQHNSEVNGFIDTSKSHRVETEAELVDAIKAAPTNESYMIGFSKDIVLEKPLEIPKDKDIFLISLRTPAVCLIGADGMDTIIVRSGGSLILYGNFIVTHMEGDSGRGVHVKRGGTLYLMGAMIAGNSADKGGGVYNEGYLSVSGYEQDFISIIVNNTATVGGGVYDKGTHDGTFYGEVQGNTALSGEGDNVFIEEPVDGEQFYLLAIVIAVVIVGVVAGLLFYHSKKQKISNKGFVDYVTG